MDKVTGLRWLQLLPGILILLVLPTLPPGHEAAAGEGKADKSENIPITITSRTMKADRTSKTIIFKGDVEAREDFLLCSDELYMHYTDSNEVKKIDARGNVRIYRSSGLARSERAIYDREEHILLLSGDAVIERCADTVRGDRITLYLDDDSALVEGDNNGRVKAVIVPGKKCPGEGEVKKKGAGNGAASGVFDVNGANCKKSR